MRPLVSCWSSLTMPVTAWPLAGLQQPDRQEWEYAPQGILMPDALPPTTFPISRLGDWGRRRRSRRMKTGAGVNLFARLNNTTTMPTVMKSCTELVLKVMEAGYCLYVHIFMKNIKSLKPFNFYNSNPFTVILLRLSVPWMSERKLYIISWLYKSQNLSNLVLKQLTVSADTT